MTENDNTTNALWLMLGDMRGDLKWLVEERRTTARRLDDIEAGIEQKIDEHAERLNKLEQFKVSIGVLTTGLGILVPTVIAIIVKALGLL
jgi:hypothetical protein